MSTTPLLIPLMTAIVACSSGTQPTDPDGQAVVHDAASSSADTPTGADAHPDCAVPVAEQWSGSGDRDNESGYPDHIKAMVVWTRTATVGCIDSYVPSGFAHYGYAIPGALCSQSIVPEEHSVVPADGILTIDRSTAPATYQGNGATYWTFKFRCTYPDGTFDESDVPGGARWFDSAGVVGEGAISGTELVDDEDLDASIRCGPNGTSPCSYAWSFTKTSATP